MNITKSYPCSLRFVVILLIFHITNSTKPNLQFKRRKSNIDLAKLARFVVHNSDWASIATVSSENFPTVNLKSISDGPAGNGTGIVYFYITEMDFTGRDLSTNNNCSVLVSLAETDYCKRLHYDAQDPRCVRVILKGSMANLTDHNESEFAKMSLFSRHPIMKTWPIDHQFHATKMNLTEILLINYFGGAKTIDIDEYLNAIAASRKPQLAQTENTLGQLVI